MAPFSIKMTLLAKPKNVNEFYGLRGITHGGAKILTVMATQGRHAIDTTMVERDNLLVYPGIGELVQFHEQRSGALNSLIDRYAIRVLSKAEWDEKKKSIV